MVAVQVEDRGLRAEVGVRVRAVQLRVHAVGPEVEPFDRRGGAEGLHVLVEDKASPRLAGEPRLDVRRRGGQRELPREVGDPAAAVDIEHVGPVHPADELLAEADDLVEGTAHPRLGTVQDRRVPVDRRDKGPDEHLRIAEAANEDARRARAVELGPVDQGLRAHHRVVSDEDRAAGLPAQELRGPALHAQSTRNCLAGLLVEEPPHLHGGEHVERPMAGGLKTVTSGYPKRRSPADAGVLNKY